MNKLYKTIVLSGIVMLAGTSLPSSQLHADFKRDILEKAAICAMVTTSATHFNGNTYD